MILTAALVAGFLAGRLAWLVLRSTLLGPPFLTTNYRGNPVATAAGIVVILGVLLVEAARTATGHPPDAGRGAIILATAGFGFLGLLDDLGATPGDRGFKGHLRALAQGRVSTGGAKLIGGGAVAMLAVGVVAPTGPGRSTSALFADAVLVALAANLANLLDHAPGRILKAAAAAYVGIVAATRADPTLAGVALTIGAGLALLLDDLHERAMVGDTGANVLGASLGLGVVATSGTGARLGVLTALVVLNGLSEFVSFSRIIEAVPPLGAIDRAGRRP